MQEKQKRIDSMMMQEGSNMQEAKTPLKAIRLKCLDCTCQQIEEVKGCTITGCALYPFRLGKNPYNKRVLTDEQRQAASERLKKLRAEKQK